MKKVLMLFFCSLILYGCGEDAKEPKPIVETQKPEVEFSQLDLKNYEVIAKAKVLNNGGDGIKETGFCYNTKSEGIPSLENSKSHKVLVTYSPEQDLETLIKLHPETEYEIVFYAINEKGITYSDIKPIHTGVKDIDLLLPGIYRVTDNTSYFGGSVKDYNIEIVFEDGEYVMYGLMCEPLKAPFKSTRLLIELTKIEGNEWKYEFTIPYQLSGLNVKFENVTYPTLVVNGGWLLSDNVSSFDIKGELIYNESLEINLSTGYGLVMCDPITHEIKLDNHYPPVELVLGKNTYPGNSEQYPRPDCLLIRKIVE